VFETPESSESDDESFTATQNKGFADGSRLSKNLFAKTAAHLFSFFCTMVRVVLRLLLHSLWTSLRLVWTSLRLVWTSLRLVDHLILQHIRAMALRFVGPLFIVMSLGLLLFMILDLAPSFTIHHVLRLPASPTPDIAAQRSDYSHSPLSLDSVRTDNTRDGEARLDGVRLQRLEDALSGLSSQYERTRRDIRVVEAQAKHHSVSASSELHGLRRELDALRLLVRAYAAEIPSHASTRSELDGFRKDLDASQLLHAAESKIIRKDIEKLQLLLQAFDTQPDFALSSTGASVIPSLTSATYTRPSTLAGRIVASLTGKGTVAGRSPFTALHYDIHDGHCWPFAGSQGQLGIVLSNLVYIEAITIEHVAATVAVGRRTSAPQDMEVWALVEGQDNITKLRAWCAELAQQGRVPAIQNGHALATQRGQPARLGLSEYIRIASLRYDIHSPNNIQTFPVDAEIRDIGIDFGLVVLVVKNNWGMEEYTCLYRIRVHGLPM
jgi:hypothetical protein